MYPALGKFTFPEGVDEWVPQVRYIPEPPVVIRGSMNPWAEERQRALFLQEEKAWVEIQKLQKDYAGLMGKISYQMGLFNEKVREIERITGKKSGVATLTNYASLVYSLAGGPYAWAVALGKLILDFGMGMLEAKKKKKKVQKIVKEIEAIQAVLMGLHKQIQAIGEKISGLIQTGDSVRSAQSTQMVEAVTNTEAAYAKRQSLDRQRADVLRERNRQAFLLPRLTPGGPYDAI